MGWYFAELLVESIVTWDQGGAEMKYTAIDDQPEFMYGFRGGWQASDNFLFGYGGYVSNSVFSTDPLGYDLDMTYGGFILEFQRPMNDRVSFNFPILIGGGAAWAQDRGDPYYSNASGFFVAEPGASVSMMIMPFMKLEASGTMRLTVGSSLQGISDSRLSRPSAGIAMIFGNFNYE